MGQRDADFTDYVLLHRRKLLRTAFLICGSWTQAEDVTQIALSKLYVAWPRLDLEGEQTAYVRKIIVRSAVDERRRPWRREILTSPDDLPQRAIAPTTLDQADQLTLKDALTKLPVRQRQVIVLRYYCGSSVIETARDLGISTGSVKSHCSRALDALRSLLPIWSEEIER
jgi:RNA polymerase sigma-70 factor (sigma-E family)